MNLHALEDFQLVAAHGGLGLASRMSGRSKATLSRHVAELEEALGVRLVERSASGLALTDAGQQLFERTRDPLREVADALTATREGSAAPRGCLRVAAASLFSQLALGRLGAKFLAACPHMQLDVVAEDRIVDLIEEHFDVAIRVNPPADGTLVGRCFARDSFVIAAAPSIKRPRPDAAGQPVRVPAVVLASDTGAPWRVEGSRLAINPQPVMRASSLLMVRRAALAGAGVALLPRSIVSAQLRSGELLRWGATGRVSELWVLHTSRRLPSPKVRAFVDFMCAQYPRRVLELPE